MVMIAIPCSFLRRRLSNDQGCTLFARDLEFYQDNEGLENYAETMKDVVQIFGQDGFGAGHSN